MISLPLRISVSRSTTFPVLLIAFAVYTAMTVSPSLYAVEFESPAITGTVTEGSHGGTVVLDLRELLPIKHTDWTLQSDEVPPAFRLDHEMKQLVVEDSNLLDFEQQSEYRLTIKTTDLRDDLSRKMFLDDLSATGIDAADVDRHFGATQHWNIVLTVTNLPEPPAVLSQACLLDESFAERGVLLSAIDPEQQHGFSWRLTDNSVSDFQLDPATGRLFLSPTWMRSDSATGKLRTESLEVEVTDSTGLKGVGTIEVHVAEMVVVPTVPNPETPLVATDMGPTIAEVTPQPSESEGASPDVPVHFEMRPIADSIPSLQPETPTASVAAIDRKMTTEQPLTTSKVASGVAPHGGDTVILQEPIPRALVASPKPLAKPTPTRANTQTLEITPTLATADSSATVEEKSDPSAASRWLPAFLAMLLLIVGLLVWYRHHQNALAEKAAAERERRKAKQSRRIDSAHGRSELEMLLDQIQQVNERR
ncbi:MAG: hypothetical protein R3C01_01625 [Planctomycetaceae bacterium]